MNGACLLRKRRKYAIMDDSYNPITDSGNSVDITEEKRWAL